MTLDWLGSTDDIFRRTKPATPTPHLVAYVVLVDPDERGVYLGLHRMAGLHLPMCGHLASRLSDSVLSDGERCELSVAA